MVELERLLQSLSGAAGALVSMRFLSGHFVQRLCTALSGALFSYFAAPFTAERLEMPEGLTGFLLGLFGMAILSKVWEWIEMTPLTPIWNAIVEWVRKRLGV